MSDTELLPKSKPEPVRRLEVFTGAGRRRAWTAEQKARIVAESYAPGASATAVALRYGLHRNQIFGWRRQFRDGTAKGEIGSASFVPLAIAASSGEAGGIELIYGGVTIRPGAGFDAGELRRVLQVVRGLP